MAALVGVGDGLPCPGPDREGVGGSAVLQAAVGRSGGKTEGKSLKTEETLCFYSKLQYFLFFFCLLLEQGDFHIASCLP